MQIQIQILIHTLQQKPEVINAAQGLLGVDDVEVDDCVHTHSHRVPRQNLEPEKCQKFNFHSYSIHLFASISVHLYSLTFTL